MKRISIHSVWKCCVVQPFPFSFILNVSQSDPVECVKSSDPFGFYSHGFLKMYCIQIYLHLLIKKYIQIQKIYVKSYTETLTCCSLVIKMVRWPPTFAHFGRVCSVLLKQRKPGQLRKSQVYRWFTENCRITYRYK